MIDHDYKIVTREVTKTTSRAKHFMAQIRQVYIFIDGKRIKASYPQQEFFGATQITAMMRASKAFRHWLELHYPTL